MLGASKFAGLAKKAGALQMDEKRSHAGGDTTPGNILEETYFVPAAPTHQRSCHQRQKMSGFTRMESYKNSKSIDADSESFQNPLFDNNTTDSKSTTGSTLESDFEKPKINPFAKRRAAQLETENDTMGVKPSQLGRRGVVIDPYQQNNIRSKLKTRLRIKTRLRSIVEERLTVKQIFARYVESSTLHGFIYTCSDTYLIRRFIWACLMILGAVYFLVKLKEGIVEYFDYPFSTLSTVDYPNELDFPAISFCLANSFHLGRLKMSKLAPLYNAGRFPLSANWTDPGFDISGEELTAEIERISMQVEDIFEECDWIKRDTDNPFVNANVCGKKNFTSYYNAKGQKCFLLNSGEPDHPLLKVTHDGLSYGYDALFDTRTSDSFLEEQFTGLKVYLHSHNEPSVADSGFMLAPGFRYFIKMKMTQTINLEPPYGTECGEIDLKYFDSYNQKACVLEKLTDYVGERCACREPFMADNGLPHCSLRQTIMCSFPAKESFNEYEARQECPIDCEEITFQHQITDSRFIHNPPFGVNPTIIRNENNKKRRNTSHLLELVESLSSEELAHHVEDNLIHVLFFYGEIATDIHEQEASFDFYQFLGDMGGEIGLMLGASLLTFVEFMDLIIFLLYHQILRLYKQKKIDDIFNDDDGDKEDKDEDV